MNQQPVINGLWKGTIFGTIGSMVVGILLGIILAVMRLSTNPVLRGVGSSTPGSSAPSPATCCCP